MHTKELLYAVGCAFVGVAAAAQAAPSMELVGSYSTGLTGLESSGETAALRGDRMYVTSAEAVALDIVDVSNPANPVLITRVDLSAYGTAVNSVDVSSNNLVAVAVRATNKTDNGTIVFLTPDGTIKRTATVGALPDMVTFTHDGRKLLVANEGEPDCYNNVACTDPNGSISIIDVIPMKPTLPVTTIDFSSVTLPAGVRVFGPGATQAQDLEPEYISISDDNATAYVTLQENNAVAVIDIATATVTDVRALGYKDFNPAPAVTTYSVTGLPSIGSTAAGQPLSLGGFSGLYFEGKTPDGKLKFVTHTDRGPNGEPVGSNRPFLLPNFAPQLVRLVLDPTTGNVAITQQIQLKNSDGSLLTGLPNTAITGGTGNTAYNDEVPVDLYNNVLSLDALGGDFEGVVVAADGTFWMVDEYRPALYHFDTQGKLINRYVPVGTHAAAGATVPAPGAAGVFGIEALPAVLAQRRQNRGFEAVALQNGKLYAFVQSPIRNPASLSNSTLNGLKNIRVVEFDPATLATRQFLYVMDNPASVSANDTRADKIGDAVALPGGGFLVLERDDDAQPEDPVGTISKKIYAFNLTGATDITSKDTLYNIGGVMKSLDQMTTSELALAAVNVKPVAKALHVDLATTAYDTVEKVEGLALIDANTIAVVNDNDFGVAGISIDNTTGTFSLLPDYVPEPVLLGIIKTEGLDASDRDNVINIRNWPVYGMYQPDAIASFNVDGQRYLITANEGDARDYSGFAEEARVKSIKASYPSIPAAADDLQLGRLTVTVAPPGGDLSRPYVFGARSFSIWNASTGAQVYDSGSELEVRTAGIFPTNFNSNNDENNFDNRSDNKGPEPEGVATGVIDGRTYAFVGLERIGGAMMYDITDPTAPTFVQYLTNRDFSANPVGPDSGPEVVRFIGKQHGPNGKPMVLISNEISGTVSLWGVAYTP